MKKLVIDQKDFRQYEAEKVLDKHGKFIHAITCAELIDGHWEYFVSFRSIPNKETRS